MKYLEMLQTQVDRIKIEAEDIFYHPINSDKDAYDCRRRSDDLIARLDEVHKEVVNEVSNWNGNQMACNILDTVQTETCALRDRLKQHVSCVNSERGIHGSAPRPSVARPKAYSGGTSVMEFIEWRKASMLYLAHL